MARRPQAELRREPGRDGGRARPWLGATILLGVALIGLWWGTVQLNDPSLLPIRTLTLRGELAHVDSEVLRKVILPYAQEGFLKIDVKAVRTAVEELPWVSRVTVRRKWPDALEFEVSERKALAHWNDRALVDEQGVVFEPPRDEWPKGLVDLYGPEGMTVVVAEGYRKVRTLFESLGLQVNGVEMNERRAWRIDFDEKRELLLGRMDFDGRLQRFARVYGAVLATQKERIARVDMRYTNGFAVSWLERSADV